MMSSPYLYCERCNQIIPYDREVLTDTGELCQTCAAVLLRERKEQIVKAYQLLDEIKAKAEGR